MRKPIDEKTPLAAWATLARAEAQMSVEEVVDALAARGHAVKAATIRGIEGGSKGASARLLRFMADIYGRPSPSQAEAPSGSSDAALIVSALDRLTVAVEALTASNQGGFVGLGQVIGEAVGRLLEEQARTPAEQAAPHPPGR